MGKLAVYKYVSFLMLCLSCVAAVMTLFGLYGGTVSPIGNTAMAMLVYVLPWLMALNAVLLVYWPFITGKILIDKRIGSQIRPRLLQGLDHTKDKTVFCV